MACYQYLLALIKTQIKFHRPSPYLPRGSAAFPHLFQVIHLALRIHALPESLMLIAHQLAFLRQRHQGLLLKNAAVICQLIKNLRFQHHIACIYRCAVLSGLFPKGTHRVVTANIQDTF